MTNKKITPRIFFTDDDEDDISFFQEALKDLGNPAVVEIAKTHDQLFKLLEEGPLPDFLFLDLNIPAIDGKEILQSVRQNKAYAEVKIIIYSTSKRDVKSCYEAGADLYMIKPDTINGIAEMLKKILTEECMKDRTALRKVIPD